MPRRPDPPPVRANERLVARLGLAAWTAAGVVLALLHSTLSRHHALWWLEADGVGVLLGLYGVRYTARRPRAGTAGQEWPSGSGESPSETDPSAPAGS